MQSGRNITVRKFAPSVVGRFSPCAQLLMFSALLALVGCQPSDNEMREFDAAKDDVKIETEGHHEHHAPHGGTLIELGDHEYNAELVIDDAQKSLALYVLDAHAEIPVPIEAKSLELILHIEANEHEDEDHEDEGKDDKDEFAKEAVLTLTASPLEGEAEGTSSRFVVTGDAIPAETFAEHLHAHVHVQVTIAGKAYKATSDVGDEDHDEHDHDDHDHAMGEKDH